MQFRCIISKLGGGICLCNELGVSSSDLLDKGLDFLSGLTILDFFNGDFWGFSSSESSIRLSSNSSSDSTSG